MEKEKLKKLITLANLDTFLSEMKANQLKLDKLGDVHVADPSETDILVFEDDGTYMWRNANLSDKVAEVVTASLVDSEEPEEGTEQSKLRTALDEAVRKAIEDIINDEDGKGIGIEIGNLKDVTIKDAKSGDFLLRGESDWENKPFSEEVSSVIDSNVATTEDIEGLFAK